MTDTKQYFFVIGQHIFTDFADYVKAALPVSTSNFRDTCFIIEDKHAIVGMPFSYEKKMVLGGFTESMKFEISNDTMRLIMNNEDLKAALADKLPRFKRIGCTASSGFVPGDKYYGSINVKKLRK